MARAKPPAQVIYRHRRMVPSADGIPSRSRDAIMAEGAVNPSAESAEPPPPSELDEWARTLPYQSTGQIEVPPRLLDQVIGQDEAVEVARKAATQKRHMMLIGEPGTGKSMLARAMVDFLPKEQLQDILAYPNNDDPNEPKIRVVPSGKGKEIVAAQKLEAAQKREQRTILFVVIALVVFGLTLYIALASHPPDWNGSCLTSPRRAPACAPVASTNGGRSSPAWLTRSFATPFPESGRPPEKRARA